MGRYWGGVAALIAGFVYFHTPDGGVIAFDKAEGQVIVRPAPPGFNGNAQLLTEAGEVIVVETPCQVMQALGQACPPTKGSP